MNILNHTISDKTEQIIIQMYTQFQFKIEYLVSFEETSYIDIDKTSNVYKVYIRNTDNLSQFEDELLHELGHAIQFANNIIPMTNGFAQDDDSKILCNLENALFDIDVYFRLLKFGYTPLQNTSKYDVYYPILKKIKKSLPTLDLPNIKLWSIDFFFMYFFDSKNHCQNCLKCIDKKTYDVSRLTYKLIDYIETQIQNNGSFPVANQSAMLSLYDGLKDIIGNFGN